jgi:hypothetical protein
LEAHPEPQPVVHAPLELQAHEAAEGGFAAYPMALKSSFVTLDIASS